MVPKKSGSRNRAKKKGARKKRAVDEHLKRKKKAQQPKKKAPRSKPKKHVARKRRAPRKKSDKALRDLVRDLGSKAAAKRLKKSERTIEEWQRHGVPKRSAADVVEALTRRLAAKRRVTVQKERQNEEWKRRREELLAQKDSEVTESKQIVGVRLYAEGMVLGWAPHGIFMRLYAIVSKITDDRRWFWTPSEYLAGYDEIEEFIDFYEIDPNEYEVEFWFGDLLTDEERAIGVLVF
jgi:hypothetical protein